MTTLLQLAQETTPENELSQVIGSGLTATDWITAGVILLSAIVIARLLQTLVGRLLKRQDTDEAVIRFVSHLARNVAILAGVIYALVTLEVRMGPLLGAVGIGGLAVAFAAQSIIENTFASILLRTRRPFRHGDEITTNGHSGTVVDVNFRTVVMRTYAGERVLVPCAIVLGDAIVNHTTNGARRSTLNVGVAYATDLALAQRVLLEATASVDGVRPAPAVEAWVEEFGDSSINFALRYWHSPDRATLWRVRSAVAMSVKSAFDANDITIPFPQRVVGFSGPISDALDGDPQEIADGYPLAELGKATLMLRFTAFTERVRSSLFYVPMLFVFGGLVAGQIGIAVDTSINTSGTALPFGLTSTVESARAVLSTIAGATITFAGIAFSVSLLIIQLASSQYSPRVVHGLFRDPFNKRIMGVVVGTFTYCLIVLRAVRAPLEDGNNPVIPNISVAVAVMLGLIAILSIVAFINHSAHSMDVSQILQDVTDDAIAQIKRVWTEHDPSVITPAMPSIPTGPGLRIDVRNNGWVQHVDADSLLRRSPEGSTIRLDVSVGHYAIAGTALCTLWPTPDDPDQVKTALCEGVAIGKTRTMSQDVSYGVRQLADVALKALSPGINDPTTAQDAIFHMGAVVAALLTRDPPPRVVTDRHGRTLLLPHREGLDSIVDMAFDELRLAAAGQPTVCIYMLETLHMLLGIVNDRDLPQRAARLREQARKILASAEQESMLVDDLEEIREAYWKRFGDGSGLPV